MRTSAVRPWALVAVVAAVVLGVTTAGAAFAGPRIDAAAEQLRRVPVYVDEGAERSITDTEAGQLREQIQQSGTPMFVAVMSRSALAEAGNDQVQLLRALRDATAIPGTYAVVTPTGFRADSDTVPQAASLATASFQARRDAGTFAVLDDFVRRVTATARAQSDGRGSDPGVDPGIVAGTRDEAPNPVLPERDGGASPVPFMLIVLAIVAAGIFLLSRGQKKSAARTKQAEAADRQMLQAELSVVADDVMNLEPQVAIYPEARDDYEAAVSRYRAAQAAMEYADEPVDLIRVERVLAEARYAMSRARARVEGREPPPPPDDLRAPGRRDEPPIDLDDDGRPAYRGGGAFYGGGGWFGGGGGGGGLLTGLLLGQMLGGGHYDSGGDRGNDNANNDRGGWSSGGSDTGGGSDSTGGGDWGFGGGGDSGGGDFGGDAGGGDW